MKSYLNVQIYRSLDEQDCINGGCHCINDLFSIFVGLSEYVADPMVYMFKYCPRFYRSFYNDATREELEQIIRDYFDGCENEFMSVMDCSNYTRVDKSNFYLNYYCGSFLPWLIRYCFEHDHFAELVNLKEVYIWKI